MNDKAPDTQRPPKIHEDGDTKFDAFENRDLDAIDAECRGLNLVAALAHYWIDEETGEPTYALSISGIEEAGRIGGGIDCPIEGLRVEKGENQWHAEQQGQSLTTKLRRVGSASSSLLTKWQKPDRFGRRKAVSLAQRNAIKALLTPEQRANMITHAIDIGSVELIDPPWKGKGDEDGRKKGDRPAPGQAPLRQGMRPNRPPTKDESLDYFNGITADLTDAVPLFGDRDPDEMKRDMIRAIVRRGTQGAFYTALEMPNERLIGLIRRIERAEKKDGEISTWLRGDDWEDVLESGDAADRQSPAASGEGEDNSGATPPPPSELPAGSPSRDPEPEEDDNPSEPEESPPVSDTAEEQSPGEEEELEDLDAARELAAEIVARILETVAIEGIGATAKERKNAVDRVQTAMIKAIVRTGTGGRSEYPESLNLEELRSLTEIIEHDERAIVIWLRSGRYLTSKVAPRARQGDLLPIATTTPVRENP